MTTTIEILKAHAPEFHASLGNKLNHLHTKGEIHKIGLNGVKQFLGIVEFMADAHAQALLKLAEREWMPIDTAPRDGTRIILGSVGRKYSRLGVWLSKAAIESMMDWLDPDCELEAGWHFYQDEHPRYDEYYTQVYDLPTHWQPLPTPPGEAATPNASVDTETELKIASEVATSETQLKALQEKLERAKAAFMHFPPRCAGFLAAWVMDMYGWQDVHNDLRLYAESARACLAELEGE